MTMAGTHVNNRVAYLDALRIIACFLVIVNHTVQSGALFKLEPSLQWTLAAIWYAVCKVAVPLFVMISGALLCRKIDSPRKLAGRILRIVAVLIIFSAAYYLLFAKDKSLAGFVHGLLADDILIVYWYLYMYVLLLVLMPLLQRAAAGLSERALVVICLAALAALGIVPEVLACTGLVTFSGHLNTAMWLVFPFLALAGYYLAHRLCITRKVFIGAIVMLACTIIAEIAIIYATYLATSGTDYMRIDQAPFGSFLICAACVFVIARYLDERRTERKPLGKLATETAACSFGIYLVHMFFIGWLSPYLSASALGLPPLAATLLFEVVVFVCSLFVSAILRRIPGLRVLL